MGMGATPEEALGPACETPPMPLGVVMLRLRLSQSGDCNEETTRRANYKRFEEQVLERGRGGRSIY